MSEFKGATITEAIIDEALMPYEEPNDGKNRLTHIINPPGNTHIWRPGMKSKDVVDIARMSGQEVVALCGYRWVPKHNPDKYESCRECFKVAASIIRGAS